MNTLATPGATRTTCPYCGVGCGVVATPRPDGTVAIAGDETHPANFGRLCSKGSALAETLVPDRRLLHPQIGGERASWDAALDTVAARFAETIRDHGPDSVALYVSGQILTEDYYVANKLMKGFVGSANIDTNSRLCMASSVAGHKRTFGSDTVPGTYEDLEEADLLVLVGSNLAWCHPVLFQRVQAARARRPQMRLVVIDPRETASAREADLHLPIRADGDTALFLGALAAIEAAGAIDRAYTQAHTEGLDAALEAARPFADLDRLAEATGLDTDKLAAFLDLYAHTDKTVTVYSQGVNQSAGGTDKVSAILNCHLATGRIGKSGTGPFSVTGQPNAMGGREVGGLANQLAAHMDLGNLAHADVVRRFWNAPSVAQTPGLKAVDLFQAVADGRVRALWIMGTNPVDSLPQADGVAEALRRCPFVVVSDVVTDTDTMPFAHVALPSAAWGEKDGTVTNSERRISRQRGYLALPGDARPDWWQIQEIAKRMGFAKGFDFANAAAIFREHAALSAFENEGTRDFDIGALKTLDDAAYEALAPVQWPMPAGAAPTTRFFADGRFFTPSGRAKLLAVAPAEAPALTAERPFVLNTGRIRDQWHTMTRTGRSPRLSAHLAEPFCEIHPADAERLGIAEADLVSLSTDHGGATLRALLTPRVAPGTLFAPMHWTGQFSGAARVNALVPARTDPISGQPASKAAPAALRRVSAEWYGFAVSRAEPEAGDPLYWAKARASGGWRLELAGNGTAPNPHALLSLDPAADLLDYTDRTGQRRLAAFDADGRLLAALWLSPEPVAVSRAFAVSLLDAPAFEPQARARILAGRAGTERPDPGALVCSCFGVGANDIRRAVGGGCASVAAIGQSLRAGTNCGSCRTEIQGLIDAERRVLEPS
ncbi:nitrate reductase [Aureimonas phyllosphaerae]|uniref:Assimilatory nitrate reductase catalytic subunit n=1 Tax=Aureimonas phyllosphaerae TaxID=1166078 RepID=A0A7W6BZA3_9HYPH|nr:nitrate reductase [Aureimonas phyllosphaerae]MBB3936476.1 assimilatory nitrate reductase catalytic subunit [Aureimonas phyllosphaerae]MBB3960660.1 assimilatory nitrate reductase catalytic subunit [Aureimonas phyllosphaerae]SFF29720.1 assimilatory nitrate reductase catalytic subunit [Aureimonas phyllosphaerae]